MDTETGEMIVKRVSVPIGLEELMEGLVKEVLLKKPDDMYFFAAKYFSQLLLRRDKGQNKVKTIRSAQSLTDQREKRFQTKIPVSGVTKQLSRQFSVRGESPMRNLDSPIVSQKPKMHDRSESNNRRRNTGPPTIPENQKNIAVRKKYSRSVSTERKRETGPLISGSKRSISKKGSKEMQDASNEKSAGNGNSDKKNSSTKERQRNISLMKNISADQVVRDHSETRNISEKGDSNDSVLSNNEVQQSASEDSRSSTKLLEPDDLGLGLENTTALAENSNKKNSKEESENEKDASKEDVLKIVNNGSADESIKKNYVGNEGQMNRVDDDKQSKNEPIDDNTKLQTNVKNLDEVTGIHSITDEIPETIKSPSDTLDNFKMESENAEMNISKERSSVSANSAEIHKYTRKDSESTDASQGVQNDSDEVKEDSKAVETEERQHEANVTTDESDETENIKEYDEKRIYTGISSKGDSENHGKENGISLPKDTIGESNDNSKIASELEQSPFENIPSLHTEINGTNFETSNEHGISDSDKADRKCDSDNQDICGGNKHEKENADKEGHHEVDDSDHISVNDVQKKNNTETVSEHETMSPRRCSESSSDDNDSNEQEGNKVASKEAEGTEQGGSEVSGKEGNHSSSGNNDGMINENSSETYSSKDESAKLLGKFSENEADVVGNETSKIMMGINSSNENNTVENSTNVDEPNDQKPLEEQSNIEEAPREVPDILSDKEHGEIMSNNMEDISEKIVNESPKEEPTGIFHNGTDKTEIESVSKRGSVEDENSTPKGFSENNTNNSKEKSITGTNGNAGNETISINASAENVELLKKTSDDLEGDQTGSKTAKLISNIADNSTTENESYIEENEVKSSQESDKLPGNMSEDIESEDKRKSDTNKVTDHPDEQSADFKELKITLPETIEQNGTGNNHKNSPYNDESSDKVGEDISTREGTDEQSKMESDTTGTKGLFENVSEEIKMKESSDESVTEILNGKQEKLSSNHKNLKDIDPEKLERNETETNSGNTTLDDKHLSEVAENNFINKETVQLNNCETVSHEKEEILDEEKDHKKEDTAVLKTNDDHEHSSAKNDSNQPEENSENSKPKQEVDSKDVENILNINDSSKRNKRSLEQGNVSTESKSERKSSSEIIAADSEDLEENNENGESKAGVDVGDEGTMLNNQISYQSVDNNDSNKALDIEESDGKQEGVVVSENKTNIGIIDKVAKNYITYVIDKENLKYNHADKDQTECDISNITNGGHDDKPNHAAQQNNTDIREDNIDNQKVFDRSKSHDELETPPMIESVARDTNNTQREELKRNISSTLSIAETGLIDTPVKTFINNFISNERGEQVGSKDENFDNQEYKMTNTTEAEPEEVVAAIEDDDEDSKPNGLKTNTFDRSKLREEIQKIEQEAKLTSFKQSFNPSLLRQELEHAAFLKKSARNNGYSSTLAEAAAVVRIQSMWRGFIARKSFTKPQYNGELPVQRDENSNVYQVKTQEHVESKLDDPSIMERGNKDISELMKAVTTIQRYWRGFKARKHLNRIRLNHSSSLENARNKRHVDEDKIGFSDTMMAAIRIQKMWRGFVTRKKLNTTKMMIDGKCGNEKVVDGTNEELIQSQNLLVMNEKKHTSDEAISRDCSHICDNGVTVKNHASVMENNTNGLDGGSEGVREKDSNTHGGIMSEETSNTEIKSGHRDQKSNEDDKKITDSAVKIQSLWRGFLVRKYVYQLKKQLEKRGDGVREDEDTTRNTGEVNLSKEESERPTSMNSNDSANTVIFNDINKKPEGIKPNDDCLSGYAINHGDFDDVGTSLDEILEYPLIKDEHLIDDYQNELLDRISGKQSDSNNDLNKTIGTVLSKRVDEIIAEDMKDIGALHTSLLPKSVGQDRNESQVEQFYPKSKLERVIEESSSPTAENKIDSERKQPEGMTTLSLENEHLDLSNKREEGDSENKGSELSFCSEPPVPSCETKVIDGKPLSDYVEGIESKEESISSVKESEGNTFNNTTQSNDFENSKYPPAEKNGGEPSIEPVGSTSVTSSSEDSEIRQNEKNDDVICTHTDSKSEVKTDSENISSSHVVPDTEQENTKKGLETLSNENAQPSDLKNVKLLHSGEWHDTIVVPLPKLVTESLEHDTEKEKPGLIQGSDASQESGDNTADISSILSNSNAGLLHSGELHDSIMVPISLSSLGRTISSEGENIGNDTADSQTPAVQIPEDQTCNGATNNGTSSVAVRVLQAPEPQVLTSPMAVTTYGYVTRADEGRSAQAPSKEDSPIQSELSPSVSQGMESEGAGKAEEKNMETQAATKIQAGFRGYQVRKQLKLKNGSSDMNPPKRQCRGKGPGRSDSSKSQSNRPKDVEEKSAVKIQAGIRGFLVRRRQKKQSNQES